MISAAKELSERETEVLLYLLHGIRDQELKQLFDPVDMPIIESAIYKTCENLEATI